MQDGFGDAMHRENYRKLIEETEASPDYWIEVTTGDFTDEIVRVMQERNLSRADLARALNTSPAYVTKILRGNANLTLRSMAKLALALGMKVRLHLAPVESTSQRTDTKLRRG